MLTRQNIDYYSDQYVIYAFYFSVITLVIIITNLFYCDLYFLNTCKDFIYDNVDINKYECVNDICNMFGSYKYLNITKICIVKSDFIESCCNITIIDNINKKMYINPQISLCQETNDYNEKYSIAIAKFVLFMLYASILIVIYPYIVDYFKKLCKRKNTELRRPLIEESL